MNDALSVRLAMVASVVQRFGLTPLEPLVGACRHLSLDEPIDVAILGAFKSGKSSLLNAVLGEQAFPVGVLPVTAVITRAAAAPKPSVRVTHLDGTVEEVAASSIGNFVTEARNPDNQRQVAVVDVYTPAMRQWEGLRLVDTPGLGSVFSHNTETTRRWMPNVAIALVAVSAEHPLSDDDLWLIREARQTAPRGRRCTNEGGSAF